MVKNVSRAPLDLTMVTSFCLSGLSPFPRPGRAGNLVVHRLRSAWSLEAKLVSETLDDMHLEPAWVGNVATIERFGQVGTMAVRGFAPFVAVEDVAAGVTWAAQVAWSGSWQIELCRRGDALAISGGLADLELGHWRKTLAPDEVFVTPAALLTTAAGGVDECSQRLVEVQRRALHAKPPNEADVPVMFNEWCTNWGAVTQGSVEAIADRLQGTGVRYLIIDAGWYGKNWFLEHGDWAADKDKFPLGLKAAAAAVRQRGLVPGVWFEPETCGCDSKAFSQVEHLLKLNGSPVTAGQRRFWDLNDPFVIDYLTERLIDVLEDSGMGYLKIDYNETLGIGCDGAESPGEGLRRQVEGMYAFLGRLRPAPRAGGRKLRLGWPPARTRAHGLLRRRVRDRCARMPGAAHRCRQCATPHPGLQIAGLGDRPQGHERSRARLPPGDGLPGAPVPFRRRRRAE